MKKINEREITVIDGGKSDGTLSRPVVSQYLPGPGAID